MPKNSQTSKRERETDELVEAFHDEHRYAGREAEVAARIVNRQRAQHSETKAARAKDKAGTSPDQNLPIERYDHLTVKQITAKLEGLSAEEVDRIETYEKKHHNRVTLLQNIERRLN